MSTPSVPKFDLDGLFASEQRRKMESERLYAVILRRVHAVVRRVNALNRRLCATEFMVPRVQQSATKYVWSECVAYVVNRLVEDGFRVNVRRQNVLVLSWAHWISADAREAFHRSTGRQIDGHGNVVVATSSSVASSAAAASPDGGASSADAAAARPPKVKPASALKFRPTTLLSAAGAEDVYSADLLDQTFRS